MVASTDPASLRKARVVDIDAEPGGETRSIRQTSIASETHLVQLFFINHVATRVAFFVPVIISIPRPIAEGRVPPSRRGGAPPIAAIQREFERQVLQVDPDDRDVGAQGLFDRFGLDVVL